MSYNEAQGQGQFVWPPEKKLAYISKLFDFCDFTNKL